MAGWHTAPVADRRRRCAAGSAARSAWADAVGAVAGGQLSSATAVAPAISPIASTPPAASASTPPTASEGSHPAITRTSTSHRPSGARRIRRTIDTGLCPITAPPRDPGLLCGDPHPCRVRRVRRLR